MILCRKICIFGEKVVILQSETKNERPMKERNQTAAVLYEAVICAVFAITCIFISCSTPDSHTKGHKQESKLFVADSLSCSCYTYDAVARLSSCVNERLYCYMVSKLYDAAQSVMYAKMYCPDSLLLGDYDEALREIVIAQNILVNAYVGNKGHDAINIEELADDIAMQLQIDMNKCEGVHSSAPLSAKEILYMDDFIQQSTPHIGKAIILLYSTYQKVEPKAHEQLEILDARRKIDW